MTGRYRWKRMERYEIYYPEIARGDSSLVYVAKDGGNMLAVKVYASQWIFDNEKILENEINAFRRLHPLGIVPKLLRKPFRTRNNIHLMMELCNCGSLDMYIKQNKSFPPNIIQDITRFLAESLAKLAAIPMIHREINPRHILVSRDPNGQISYKLIGLQFAKDISKQDASSFVGTPEYISPEAASESVYDCSADIWSLGITLYELAVLSTTLKVDPSFRVIIKNGGLPPFPPETKIVPALYDLICKCLVYDPRRRPTPEGILKHPFVAGGQMLKEVSLKQLTQREEPKPKKEKLNTAKLLEMIKKDFTEYMEYMNDIGDHSIKLKCEKRTTLDPYVDKSNNPLDCGGRTRPSNRGGFSEIYFCVNRLSSERYALKVVKTSKMTDVKIAELLLGEVLIMLELKKCPFTIRIEDYFVYKNDLCLVLEYCNGGDLETYIRKLRRKKLAEFPLEELKLIAWNVACGLNEMHKLKMMHRDIKPKNILVIEDERTRALIDIKLCDYGLSKKVSDYQELHGSTILGTFDYFAPELYAMMEKRMAGDTTDMNYTFKIDVWSYGILLYFTLYGKTPIEPPGSKLSVMKQRKIIYPTVKGVPESYTNLIKRALIYDPEKRPAFEELLKDPFFSVVVLQPRLSIEPYVKGELIGNGKSRKTSVYRCREANDVFAMKIIEAEGLDKKEILREIDTLAKLKNSENIVRLYDYFAVERSVYLILKFYNGGNLENFVLHREAAKKPLTHDEQIFVAYSVIKGIMDIHTHNIIHRDIHPRNILLTLSQSNTITNAAISDFGFARILLDESAGTVILNAYQSPEMTLQQGQHNAKTDIWSYGMLLYFVVFGMHVEQYGGNHNLGAIVRKGEVKFDEKRARGSKDLVGIMLECLKVNPGERPTATAILGKPVFKKYLS
eukprot:TRINITY_DN8210_c0_g6_i1.p1 TRINITY_DN8210_c0_g6~~TRINITY_DN8210_c0_g6_i1.p1  ORF type:complete len:931 (-),score=267.56 TRINITY_DN8210_c0_g6_i1:147-2849(-)